MTVMKRVSGTFGLFPARMRPQGKPNNASNEKLFVRGTPMGMCAVSSSAAVARKRKGAKPKHSEHSTFELFLRTFLLAHLLLPVAQQTPQ